MIDSGPHDAKIMIVGQSPTNTDSKTGMYFSGTTGQLLKQMLAHVGIKYEDCYVTCVSEVIPIRGQFKYYYDDKPKRPSEQLICMHEVVRRKIEKIKPNVVIALGTEALKAITNKQSIKAWRGSILTYKGVKVIAAYNPTAVMANYDFHPIVEMDFARALKESKFAEVKYDPCGIVVAPTLFQVKQFMIQCRRAKRVAFDIETIGKHVRCISFAHTIGSMPKAITIPFIKFPSSDMAIPGDKNIITLGKCVGALSNYWSVTEELEVLDMIAGIFESEKIEKVGHNSINFDAPLLEEEFGLIIRNHMPDTMHAFHLMYSELPMGLKFISTIMCNFENYWSEKKTSEDMSEWYYCAMDSICTIVISHKIESELVGVNMWELYKHVNANVIAITAMQERGVCIDDDARIKLLEQKKKELEEIIQSFPEGFNPASPKQVKELLYDELRLPVQKKQGKITTDEAALRKLAVKYPDQPILRSLIAHRKTSKLISTFLNMKLIDGKMFTNFNGSGTKSGRLSSSKTLWETGMNLQNIPVGKSKGVVSIRHLFVPSDCPHCGGYGKEDFLKSKGFSTVECKKCFGTGQRVWIKADLAQAEALVVAEILYRHGDSTLRDLYRDPSFDIHRWMAAKYLNKPESEVTKEEREIFGKIPNHSGNYGAGPMVMVIKGAKEEVDGLDYRTSDKILEARHRAIPGLRKWWRWVEAELHKCRTLTTCFGRRRLFFGRLDSHTYRDAYSFEPQSIVGDVTNRILTKIENNPLSKLTLLLQVHDEIDGECDACDVLAVANEIIEAALIPVYVNSVPIIIPIDVEVGTNWGQVEDYKEYLNGQK
jgi:uracil-DNA glycosylase family 4